MKEVHIVILRDYEGSPYIDKCFDNLKAATKYAEYLHTHRGIAWVDISSNALLHGIPSDKRFQ